MKIKEKLNDIIQADKIREVHRLTKLMMDATPICSMLWDKDGNIFDCNEESVKCFKMKDKQEFLKRFFEFSPEYQPNGKCSKDHAAEYIRTAFIEGKCKFEWMHQLLDGTPVPCEMTLVRVKHDDGYIVAAYARDLREHKRMMSETLRLQKELETALKDAQETSRIKSSFLASMSHEMRTPLNAVVGLSELILNTGNIRGDIEDKLEKIHASGMTLLGIVNDILDISKIESGKFEIHPAEYGTPSLINDIVTLNVIRIGEKPITFNLTVDEKLPGVLYGDDLRVKQIFNNFLSNAFKYTNSGSVEWRVSFEKDGGSVWIVSDVKDTGIGIKPEDMAKLFQDYSQVDAETNRKAEGTGLGLAITKRLVDMMGGTINVESEYGKGTVFTVRLRQGFVSDIPIGKETAESLMSARFTASKRNQSAGFTRIDLSYANVLVVDDVPTNLDVIKGMLKPYGIRVDCASGGKQAIDMIRSENPRYDAVFMDHMMPGMDGIETAAIIHEKIGTDYARKLPIIALTANAIAGNEKMFLEKGFQGFVSKPIDMVKLDSVLRRWVRDKKRENEQNLFEGMNINIDINMDMDMDMDMDAGIERFGGKEEYMKILRSYFVNTPPILESMKKHLKSKNLRGYAIDVHGIKGSSFGICAMRAGKNAERLEQLAKAGEKENLLIENGAFIEYMGNFLNSVGGTLIEYDLENKKPAAGAPDPDILRELRKACEKYDMDEIDNIMTQLESFEYENENGAELMTWLREQVDDMNLDAIYNHLQYFIL